ncbi:MAG: cytochrome c biogenesis protein DipZ [bacterium]|nr:cytochrome c biogenesis protein DipZ [bacterium]
MILLLISFIAGVLTVLAPCILPLLPVIVGGSLTGEGKDAQKKKVLTIVISLGLSVIAFTLLLKASTLFIAVPEYVWKWISGGIIIGLGLITVFPSLWEGQLLAKLSAKSNILLGKGARKKSFWGDVIVGAALGPVFSTCSPTYFIVLATVLPVQPIIGIIYLLAYTIGLSLSLFVIAFVGQRIMTKLNIAADPKGWVKRTLGILFLIVGIAVIFGLDKQLQTSILNAGIFDVTKIEQKLLEISAPLKQDTSQNTSTQTLTSAEKKNKYTVAPEISSPDGFVNTDGKPITLQELRGKVVLLDVWTYSCINCQRTLPYLNDWYVKYKDQGLEIIGLHTPEFAFEKVLKNVEAAVKKFDIKYPVVLDNDYSTWNDYGNRYWPRKYLIDIDGYIVYDHIGEGGYEETEKAIQKALSERNARMGSNEVVSMTTSAPKDAMVVESGKVGSREIYFGSSRRNNSDGVILGGSWSTTSEYAENKGQATITYNYDAKNVYFVGGSKDGVEIEIYKDGVFLKTITVKAEQLYTLIEGEAYGKHILQMKIKGSGLQAFTFTFG